MQTAFASKSLLPVAGMEMTAPHWDWVSIRLPHIAVYIGSQHGLAHVKIRDLCNLESSWLTCCICFSGIYYGHQNVNTQYLCTYLRCLEVPLHAFSCSLVLRYALHWLQVRSSDVTLGLGMKKVWLGVGLSLWYTRYGSMYC